MLTVTLFSPNVLIDVPFAANSRIVCGELFLSLLFGGKADTSAPVSIKYVRDTDLSKIRSRFICFVLPSVSLRIEILGVLTALGGTDDREISFLTI